MAKPWVGAIDDVLFAAPRRYENGIFRGHFHDHPELVYIVSVFLAARCRVDMLRSRAGRRAVF